MRRRLALMTAFAAALGGGAGLTGCGGDGGGYEVKAMFHNAFTIIPGEDVKVAGVPVGTIKSLDVENGKAAAVLQIDDKNFQDFRKDASCAIRPQALIGERYVECKLTQQRAPDAKLPPPLEKQKRGPNEGMRVLPTSQTSNPIDLDLVLNTAKLPYRQRLSIILSELGVGLAGNGQSLKSAVRAANPALRETERLLKILGDQNRALAQIATDGDAVLQPLAARRAQLASAIDALSQTTQATAAERAALEDGLRKMPAMLRQLRPTMRDLGALTDEAVPVTADLRRSASDINRMIVGLGDLADAGIPAVDELGRTAVVGRRALNASRPLLRDLRDFSREARPLLENLNALTASLKETGGIERLMDFLYFTTASMNGYDADGHYQRGRVLVNACQTYATVPAGQPCTANFSKDRGAGATAAQAKRSSAKVRARGVKVDGKPVVAAAATRRNAVRMPAAVLPGEAPAAPAATGEPTTGQRNVQRLAGRGQQGRGAGGASAGDEAVLDYLMGD